MPQRQDLAPKTSMAGLPSAIPSRPLKENKAKVIPNYIKKTKQGRENDFDDTTDDLDDERMHGMFMEEYYTKKILAIFNNVFHAWNFIYLFKMKNW